MKKSILLMVAAGLAGFSGLVFSLLGQYQYAVAIIICIVTASLVILIQQYARFGAVTATADRKAHKRFTQLEAELRQIKQEFYLVKKSMRPKSIASILRHSEKTAEAVDSLPDSVSQSAKKTIDNVAARLSRQSHLRSKQLASQIDALRLQLTDIERHLSSSLPNANAPQTASTLNAAEDAITVIAAGQQLARQLRLLTEILDLAAASDNAEVWAAAARTVERISETAAQLQARGKD